MLGSAGGVLRWHLGVSTIEREQGRAWVRTQAASHFFVESEMTCAMRFVRGEGAACTVVEETATRATRNAEKWTIVGCGYRGGSFEGWVGVIVSVDVYLRE